MGLDEVGSLRALSRTVGGKGFSISANTSYGTASATAIFRMGTQTMKPLVIIVTLLLTGCAGYDTSLSVGYRDANARITINPVKNSK